jgi:hypothetical protein
MYGQCLSKGFWNPIELGENACELSLQRFECQEGHPPSTGLQASFAFDDHWWFNNA